MTYCANTAAANAHEVREARLERHYDWAESEYDKCIQAPVLIYRVDRNWSIDDAERLHKVLKVVLGSNVQVIYDANYPDFENDTDCVLFGVMEPVRGFALDVIIETLCTPNYGEKQAQEAYDWKLGEWQND